MSELFLFACLFAPCTFGRKICAVASSVYRKHNTFKTLQLWGEWLSCKLISSLLVTYFTPCARPGIMKLAGWNGGIVEVYVQNLFKSTLKCPIKTQTFFWWLWWKHNAHCQSYYMLYDYYSAKSTIEQVNSYVIITLIMRTNNWQFRVIKVICWNMSGITVSSEIRMIFPNKS